MKRRWLFWSAVTYLGLLGILATFGPTFRYDFLKPSPTPFEGFSATHWFGTDDLGRDVFARLAYGARMSLLVGICVQALALLIGISVGLVGSFGPKTLRQPILRLTDAMFAFPDILLAILIIGLWGRGLFPVIAALAVTSWPAVARLVVTQSASLKEREYVTATLAMGASMGYTVVRHVLPHLWRIVLSVSMIDMAGNILAESALSFLGIGIQSPYPSWGSMIKVARDNLESQPIMLLWPCLILSVTIFALNIVGDGLSARLDPKQRS